MQISVMCGLIEDSWVLEAASIGNLLRYVVLVEIGEDNPASVFGKNDDLTGHLERVVGIFRGAQATL